MTLLNQALSRIPLTLIKEEAEAGTLASTGQNAEHIECSVPTWMDRRFQHDLTLLAKSHEKLSGHERAAMRLFMAALVRIHFEKMINHELEIVLKKVVQSGRNC